MPRKVPDYPKDADAALAAFAYNRLSRLPLRWRNNLREIYDRD